MKRVMILATTLLLLAGCGAVVEPTNEETTTAAQTTAETASALNAIAPQRLPFTKDDIAAIEQGFPTVGAYAGRVPAQWYRVEYWEDMGGEVAIGFFDHEPTSESEAFLCLLITDNDYRFTDSLTAQELPPALLGEKAELHGVDFAKTGTAIEPPRGIAIGSPVEKLFEAYPDHRGPGQEDVLYDITLLHPDAKRAWGEWDGEGDETYGFFGGRVTQGAVRFTFAEQPWNWDSREEDYTWVNMYTPRWCLSYLVANGVVTGIEYRLSYHPG